MSLRRRHGRVERDAVEDCKFLVLGIRGLRQGNPHLIVLRRDVQLPYERNCGVVHAGLA